MLDVVFDISIIMDSQIHILCIIQNVSSQFLIVTKITLNCGYLYLKAIQNYRLIQFHKIFYCFTRQVKTCSRRSRTPITPLTCKRKFQDMSTYVCLNFWTSYNLCANAHISMSETVSSPQIKTTVENNWPDTNIPFSIYEMISEKWQRQKIIIEPDIIVFGAIYPPFGIYFWHIWHEYIVVRNNWY